MKPEARILFKIVFSVGECYRMDDFIVAGDFKEATEYALDQVGKVHAIPGEIDDNIINRIVKIIDVRIVQVLGNGGD